MVATVLLTMVLLGVLSVLIGSYRIATKARYNDQARYVIKSFADQFLTQQTTDGSGNVLAPFVVTSFATNSLTAFGLTWTDFSGASVSGGTDTASESSAPTYITVLLGETTGGTIQAQVTHTVNYLYGSGANAGTATTSPQNTAAGYLLEAQYTITPTSVALNGESLLSGNVLPQSQTITVVRAVP